MKTVASNNKSTTIRFSHDEWSVVYGLLKLYHSHQYQDEDSQLWVDDGSLICSMDNEDKKHFDKLINTIDN